MSRTVRIFSILAGMGDALTGLLLVASPLLALRLMRVGVAPTEPIYLRFIGVFVAAVGLLYLYPFLTRSAQRRDLRLRGALEVTAIVRTCVALFIAAALATGALEPAWASVLFTDGLLAAIQLAILGKHPLHAA